MATAPTPEELGPLLSKDTASLDQPAPDYEEPDGAFMAAARTAVGTDVKARALKDAMVECLREHGLLGGAAEAEDDSSGSVVGEGFEDF